MVPLITDFRGENNRPNRARCLVAIALVVFAASSVASAGQDKAAPAKSAPKAKGIDQKPIVAKGEVVKELDKAILHVFQAKNGDYWFGSQGAYRWDGKTLTLFSTKDGLSSNGIGGFQEDKAGNLYIASGGVTKFDGQTFTKLSVAADFAPTDWKLQPDDLWFSAGQDSGAVYRYDGKALHLLKFPKTKAGEDATLPRDKYPNAKYSPYDVYLTFKDSKGNVWFGTAILGACRYDGKTFAWLPNEELRNDNFGTRSIVEDKHGKFWFCDPVHRYAVDLSDPAKPSFKREEGIRDAKNKVPFGGIMSSVMDSKGALWMATYRQGVWRYDGKSATHYPVKDEGKDIHLFSIHKDNQGVMWLGTQNNGVYKFNGKTFEKFRP